MIKQLSTWKSYSFITLIILICCYFESAVAQAPNEQNHKPLEVEKIHLHFDKPFYSAGDTLWFKAYLVNAANELTEQSKILHVDLINESDLVLKSLKVPLAAGLGWADIPLGKELPGGNYRIRAYTNWLRNFGEEYFFQKIIPVSDVFQTQVAGNISYSYASGQLIADMRYNNLDGTPLSDKEISYKIPKNERSAISGRGKTDADGRLRIRIDTTDLGSATSLTARMKIDADTLFKTFSIPVNSSNFDVQFFPEGGELVNNIPSRIGFKVVGSGGLGLKANGYITDQSNTRIVSFDTEFAGMGVFGINPQPGGKYTAYIKLEEGVEKQFPLPGSLDRGFIMTVSEDEKHVLVKIKSGGLAKSSPVTLQASSQGKVYVNSSNTLSDKQLIIKILKDDLPIGISRLSLLSNGDTPLAERLVFIDRTDELNISLDSLQDTYSVRSKVSPKIRVTDELGKPVLAHLSLSVVDERKVPYDEYDELTILSNLLLTSELKGHIEQPNYYFTDKDKEKKRQLDILMMTQGWRRFAQKDSTPSKLPELNFAAEHGLYVKGRVLTPLNAPVSNAKISLLIQGTGQGFTSMRTNEKGEFSFDSLYIQDHAWLVLNALTEKGKDNVKIVLDSIPEQRIQRKAAFWDLLPNIDSAIVANSEDEYLAYLKRYINITRTQVLNEVVVRAPKKRLVENSSNLNNRDATWTFLEEQIQNQLNLSEILQKVPAVIVKGNKAYRMRDLAMSMGMAAPPINVILDGAPMGPDLDLYNLNDFEAIEVLTNSHDIGLYKGPVILLTTKTVINHSAPPLGQLRFTAQGYAPVRQFYSPQYDAPGMDDQYRDLRSTIYWNPNILTNSRERSDVSFFTGQTPGTYKFIIEGVDEFGRLGRTVFIREIK